MATPAGTVSAATVDGNAHSWEASSNVWDSAVQEDENGNIVVASGDTLAQTIRKRRKRAEQNDYSQRNRRVVRDMIRYVYVLIDGSRWMRQKDPALPGGTRFEVTIAQLQQFVMEYYDQNPLSHLGFVLLKNGEAEILTQLSGSSKTHKVALESLAQLTASEAPSAGGEFSLQNALEVAGRSLGHQPRHGSREIVVLTAALSTCDPGFILTETLPKLRQAKIRVSCFALAAELYICRKLAEETAGTMGVCLDRQHYRDWLLGQCVPPPAHKQPFTEVACEMIQMGFPTRTVSEVPELIHATRETTILARTAYTCPQCQAKNAELPTDCAVCGLKLVLAPHLARSFHHLFPVSPFVELPMEPTRTKEQDGTVRSNNGKTKLDAKLLVTSEDDDRCCYSCLRPLTVGLSKNNFSTSKSPRSKGDTSGSDGMLRFRCPNCNNLFCIDCEAYLHETLHNCPGCLCL